MRREVDGRSEGEVMVDERERVEGLEGRIEWTRGGRKKKRKIGR